MATITSLGFNIRSNWDGSGVRAAMTDLEKLQAEMRRISGAALHVDVVVDGAEKIEALRADMESVRGNIEITFDINEASYAAAEARIATLVRDRTVDIDFDTSRVNGNVEGLTQKFYMMNKAADDSSSNTSRLMRNIQVAAVAAAAAVAVLPALINLVGAALLALPAAIGLGLGAFFLSKIDGVKTAFSDLGETAKNIGVEAVQPMVQPVLAAVDSIRVWMYNMKDQFRDTFEGAAQLVQPLTDALLGFVTGALPGFNVALGNSVPLIRGMQEGLKNLGQSLGIGFATMSTQSKAFGMTFNQVFTYTGLIFEKFSQAAANMAVDTSFVMGDVMRSVTNGIGGILNGMAGYQRAIAAAPSGLQIFRTLGDALEIILPALGRFYAAFSQAFGTGLNNGVVGISTFIASGLDALANALGYVAPYITQFSGYLKLGFEALSQLNPMLAPAAAGIGLMIKALNLIKGNPIVVITFAIIVLVGYLVDLERRTGIVSETWNKAFEFMRPVLQPIIDGVKALKTAFDDLGGVQGILDATKTKIGELHASFNKDDGDGGGFTGLGKKITDALGPVSTMISSVVATVGPALSGLWKSITDSFAPIWDQIRPGLQDLWESVQELWVQLEPVLKVLGAVFVAVFGGVLMGAIGALTSAMPRVIEVIVSVINTITGVIRGVVTVVTGFVQVIKGAFGVLEGVVKFFAALFTGNGEAMSNAWNKITRGFHDMLNGLGNAFLGIGRIIKSIWDGIIGVFSAGIQWVVSLVTGFVRGVIGFFTNLWDVLVGHSIVPDMINAIIKWFLELPGKIIGMVREWVANIIQFFVDLALKIVDAWRDWMNKAQAGWDAFSGALRAAWDAFWGAIRDAAAAIWNWIKDKWNDMINGVRIIYDAFATAIKTAWDAFWGGIRDAAVAIWNFIKAQWDAFGQGVRDILATLVNFVKDAWERFWNGLKESAQKVWDMIKDGWNGLKNSVVETVEFLVDKVEEIWNKITGIFQKPVDAVKGIWNSVAGTFGLPTFAVGGPVVGMATGGPLRGKGTGTSDDIPAYLSNGEHVWTAKEVEAAGGHDNVIAMRQGVLKGDAGASIDGMRLGLATGGPALAWMVGQQQVHAPALQLTSGVRNEPGSYHHTGQAGDFSNAGNEGSPEMKAFAGWIANTWGRQTLELIHSPFDHNIGDGMDVGNGMNSYYNPGTMAEHRNHVHWAVPNALNDDQMGAAIPGGMGVAAGPSAAQIEAHKNAVEGIKTQIRDTQRGALASIFEQQLQYAKYGGSSPVSSVPMTDDYMKNAEALAATGNGRVTPAAGTMKSGVGAIGKLDAALSAAGSVGGPIGGTIPEGERLAIIEEAMRITNTPPPSTREAWLAGMNTLITRESNWNAGARNDWDSNAAAGNNSVGLAQVIPTTFAANKAPGYDNIYGAVDNVAASINYIKGRYGSIENVQQANANMPPQGYALGTRNASAGVQMVGERGPELVNFRGGETVSSFDQIISEVRKSAGATGEGLRTKMDAEFRAFTDRVIDASKDQNRDLRTTLEAEIRALVTQLAQDSKTSANQVASAVEDAVERAIAMNTGLQLDLNVAGHGGNIEAIVKDAIAQILPQVQTLVQQRVGSR